jgi:dinuclear metal center YbgI/SA1388 family protein
MIPTREVVDYLDGLLQTASVPDFPNAVNGLQLENSGSVSRVAACVDFSSRAVARAAEEKADLLIVHHGMFWSGVKPITAGSYARMRMLIENGIAVYSSHLPLDGHPEFGNNVLLSRELGLESSGEFAWFKGFAIGLTGEANVSTRELLRRARSFAQRHGGDAIATEVADDHTTRKWAMCTGAGASSETLQEASALGVDTLIVGEGPHHTAIEAGELGIVVIYAGHYATETPGVEALARHLAEKFGIGWTMIHAPTGL